MKRFLLLPALFLVLPAAARPPAAAQTLFGVLLETRKAVGSGPVAKALDDVASQARAQPPERRDELVQQALAGVNAAAAGRQTPAVCDALAGLDNGAGDFEDAVRLADRSIAADPSDERAWVERSSAGFGLRRYVSALADAERALELDARDPAAYRARAMARYGLKRYPQAAADARRALAIDPKDRAAFFIAELAEGRNPSFKLDSLAAARPRAGAAPSPSPAAGATPSRASPGVSAPAAPNAVNGLDEDAARKLAIKDYEGALADADRALADDPSDVAAYYYRAEAHNFSGDYEAAADDASKALDLNPRDAAARDTRAWAFNHMGRFRDAIADSNHSLEINPTNPYAFANLGYAYEQMGDLSAMLRDLKTAATMNAQFAPAYRDAAQRHGLEPDPLPFEAPAPAGGAPARGRSFVLILASSLLGGLLIALGVVQLVSETPKAQVPPPPAPAVPAGYILGRKLGMGGMGIVYEAYDKMLERKVAIKRIRQDLESDADLRRRLLTEARTVASLHHPGIIDIHSVVEDKSGLYLVFELLEGKTAADLLAERGRLDLAECKRILKPVCEALDFAHRHLVVHRDLKPANIMITEDGPVKVLDFGISRQTQIRLASKDPADRRTGTPQYMSPEQERGLVRRESDVFSLGICLYEMLTGRHPFPDPSGFQKQTLDYIRPSKADPALPPELDAFFDKALAPSPEDRISSAMEFWRLLDTIPSARA